MNRKQTLRRVISLCLVLAMVFGTLGISGWEADEAYADSGTAYVRIIGENNEVIITDAAVSIENGVTTLGAVVLEACEDEGRTFELNDYNYPGTIGGIELPRGYSWMSMLNDSGNVFNSDEANFTSIAMEDGDRIALYADNWQSSVAYSYFTVTTNGGVSVMEWEGTSYITGSIILKLQTADWNGVSESTGTEIIVTDDYGVPYFTDSNAGSLGYGFPPSYPLTSMTSNSGSIALELYGNCQDSELPTFEKTFIVTSTESNIVKPYCKVVMTSTGMTISQPLNSEGGSFSGPMVSHNVDISSDVGGLIAGIRDASDEHAATYYDSDWALGMAAAGLTPTEDEKAAFLTNVLLSVSDSSTTAPTMSKIAIALTAFNIDATRVPDRETGMAINLIEQIATSDPDNLGQWGMQYDAPSILSLYDLENYSIPQNATVTREWLLDELLADQAPDGSWSGEYGADGTAMALSALAPYYHADSEVNGISIASCSAITAAADAAIKYLASSMGEYGDFGNIYTQATVLTGLHALNIDTHEGEFYNAATAMDNLLSYKTSENKIGSEQLNPTCDPNVGAYKQGLCALATYQNLTNSRSSNLYHFSADVAPYTNWPDADLLTSISVTTLPTKTQYRLNESGTVDAAGMVVKAMYNGDASTLTPVAIANCTVSTIDCSSAGNKTVTVTYQGQEATFVVTVLNANAAIPEATTARVSVKNGSKTLASGSYEIEAGRTSAMDILKTVLNDKGIDYVIKSNSYIVSIAGKGEFDEGANSGWLYSVNGSTPSTTAADDYELKSGDVVQWYYTLDYTTDSSSKKWSGTTVETTEEVKNVATGTAEVSATIGSNGTASAKVDAKTVTTAISDAEAAAKKTGDASTAVVIKVEADKAATAVETSIPKASVTELKNKIGAVTVDTPLADITLDKETLETIASQAPADVKISVSTVDKASLTNVAEETKAEIADRPVYDFTVTSGDKTISEFGGKVSVSVPYTPAEGEDAAAIVIYYLNDKGGLEVVRDCKYDPATKTVKFSTNHFSTYVVGYNPVSFTDTKNHWAKETIEYLAVRNLVDGMSESEFAPNSQITRAQFVQLLANMSGADLSTYSKLPFDDVTATAWYAAAADWAYETGVITGTTNKDGRTYFNPNANITRQDMAVMLARYAEKIEKYTITGTNKAITFSDDASIAGYAKAAVSKMQQAGIINGKTAATFAPTDNATRAEASKMLAAFIQML